MSKDPAFLFYHQDFFTGVSDMTNEEVGAYIKCLCIQASKGGISEKHMSIICQSHEVHNSIKIKFIFNAELNLFENTRLKNEIEKRKKYSESRSTNRKSIKKLKENTIDISKSYDKHMENENINIDNKVKKVKFDLLTDGGWNNDLETYNGINTNYPKLFKMKRPLLFKEHERLVKKWGLAKIKDTYRDMEGWAELLKKRDWAAGCADAWNTREAKK